MRPGTIEFIPVPGGLKWSIDFELPRCSFLDKRFKTWIFNSYGIIKNSRETKEISMYRAALFSIRNQIDEWLAILGEAVEHENKHTD